VIQPPPELVPELMNLVAAVPERVPFELLLEECPDGVRSTSLMSLSAPPDEEMVPAPTMLRTKSEVGIDESGT
jgi:hypothetical protein